jgi:alpha-glucosidase
MGNVDQYAWSWGETVLAHARAALELRYRLLPYLYAAFVHAAETGAPVQRPLVFEHQDDPLVRDIDDEYLLGGDLLVAPVTQPGQTARQVYLPAGEWYHWHTGERFAGGAYVLAPTPMDRIPLYARAGAVIPMWPDAPATTAGHHPEAIELHVFVPEADGEHRSLLREDDGLTRDGGHLTTTFKLARRGDRVTLRAEVEGDGYPEFRRTAFRLVVHGAEAGSREIANAGTGLEVAFEV